MARVLLHRDFVATPLAHRGYHDVAKQRPENSLSAFGAAVAAGYGIELDVQLSADGQAMVFHDDTLDRMTHKTGAVLDHTAAELGGIKLQGSDDLIPTLGQVLALVAGKVPALIEIKAQLDTMADTSGRLETAVALALATYTGPVAVMSFNPHCMAHVSRLAPKIARGLTTDDFDPVEYRPIPASKCDDLRDITDYDRTLSSFISHKAADLSRPRVAQLKSQGATILCWTIRSPEAEAKARQIADNITFEDYAARVGA